MKNKKQYSHLYVVRPGQPSCPKYPNAADHNYYTQKAVDVLTAVVSCMGFISAMAFLVTMS